MKPLSQLAEQLPRSGIRAVMEIARETPGTISLAVGEPSFKTPAHIIDAACAAAYDGHTRYTPNAGINELRAAVAARYAERWKQPIAVNEVLIGSGAVNAILASLIAVVEEGDEVLVPDPGWPNYGAQIQIARGVQVTYPMRSENGYLPDLEELDRLVTPKTKVVITNNPSNPCGVVWPKETVEAFMAWAQKRDLWIIADEIYEDLVYVGEMVSAAPIDRERVIFISGCSKSYAMTGWRIGWAIAPAALIALSSKAQEAVVSCPSDISQRAALAALTGPQECVEEMRQAYHRRRDLVQSILQPAGLLPAVPSGAFYALADMRSTGLPSQEVAIRLIKEEGIATAPGTAFGVMAEGFVRISLASSEEELRVGCERIVAFADRVG